MSNYKLEVNTEIKGNTVEVHGRCIDIEDKAKMGRNASGKHVPQTPINLFLHSPEEAKALGEALIKLSERMSKTKRTLQNDVDWELQYQK